MSKVTLLSRHFPVTHFRKGTPTHFVEKIWKSLKGEKWIEPECYLPEITEFAEVFDLDVFKIVLPKHHTIRSGNRFKVGDYFSPRVWSDKPYKSKQIVIAPDLKVLQTYDFELIPSPWLCDCDFMVNGKKISGEALDKLAENDGLDYIDFATWFAGQDAVSSFRKPFKGQIICWAGEDKVLYR